MTVPEVFPISAKYQPSPEAVELMAFLGCNTTGHLPGLRTFGPGAAPGVEQLGVGDAWRWSDGKLTDHDGLCWA